MLALSAALNEIYILGKVFSLVMGPPSGFSEAHVDPPLYRSYPSPPSEIEPGEKILKGDLERGTTNNQGRIINEILLHKMELVYQSSDQTKLRHLQIKYLVTSYSSYGSAPGRLRGTRIPTPL